MAHNECCNTPVANRSEEETTYRPRFDIHETSDELVLYGDLPGVRPEDLEIHYEKGELVIRGKVAARHNGAKRLYGEYGVGNFQRSFAVADLIDADAISAELKDGVLQLHLPKAEAAKPRRIQVKA
jgi:HSP20 family molecular chaperone IbpA